MIKRILVFEFIVGGGLSQQELPVSLANEGKLMLTALVDQLADIPFVQLTVMQDWRCQLGQMPDHVQTVTVYKDQSVYTVFSDLIDEVEGVWLIAPETDSVLENISKMVEERSKVLLNSSSRAVAICSDKLSTIQCLERYGVAVLDTVQLDKFSHDFALPWVIKSKDGVGCLDSYYVATEAEYNQTKVQIKQLSDYVIQPYMEGEAFSLSCLFKGGRAWFLCCNKQQVLLKKGRFILEACDVNIDNHKQVFYQQLIEKVAQAIPGLWGYIGIDIIQTAEGESVVLEINPRLTTSYVGIEKALGVSVGDIVVSMLDAEPQIKVTTNQQITVSVVSNK